MRASPLLASLVAPLVAPLPATRALSTGEVSDLANPAPVLSHLDAQRGLPLNEIPCTLQRHCLHVANWASSVLKRRVVIKLSSMFADLSACSSPAPLGFTAAAQQL